MFCKWCGMESETSDVCSWCRKPFSTTAATLDTPASTNTQPGSEDTPPTVEAIASKAAPELSVAPTVTPLGAAFEDEMEDDLNPIPFVAPSRSTVSEPPASKPPPPATPVTPVSSRSATPPPAYTPPIPSQRLGGGYTPAAPRQPADRPPMEAIPIKGKSTGTGAPPPIIPIARPSQPTSPPQEPTPEPVKKTPEPEAAAPETAAPIPTPAPEQAPPITLRAAAPVTPTPTPPFTTPESAPEEATAEKAPPTPTQSMPTATEPEILDLPPLTPVASEPEDAPIVTAGKRYDLGRAASTPPPAPTTAMPRGARTYYCRWCGMESDNPDRCSWCRRDLRNMPVSGQGGKGPVITTTKGPVKGKTAPVRQPVVTAKQATAPKPTPATPAPRPAPAPAGNGAPALGTFQAQKSKYYADKVMDTVSGTHYDADTGQATDASVVMVEDLARDERQEQIKSTANYLGSLALLATLASVAVHFVPSWYLGLMAVSNFFACMLMTVMRVVPFSDDDSSDMPLALALFLLAGPFVGFIAYIILGIMKQDANPAIVGIFITYLSIRIPLDLVYGASLSKLFTLPFADITPVGLATMWMTFAGLLGWLCANIFHKTDE